MLQQWSRSYVREVFVKSAMKLGFRSCSGSESSSEGGVGGVTMSGLGGGGVAATGGRYIAGTNSVTVITGDAFGEGGPVSVTTNVGGTNAVTTTKVAQCGASGLGLGGTTSGGGVASIGGTTTVAVSTQVGGTTNGGTTNNGIAHTGIWKITALGDSITGTTCYPLRPYIFSITRIRYARLQTQPTKYIQTRPALKRWRP